MIQKVRGDILEADVQALVNTVNTVGVMGRGIALQFKKAFPENDKAYRRVCLLKKLEPGMVFTYDMNILHNPRYIINFPTKRHWREKSKMEYIESGLHALVGEINRLGIESIALPPLGCGLGGLDWGQVYLKIEQALAPLSLVKIFVYEPVGAPETTSMKSRTSTPRMTVGRAALLELMKRYLDPLLDDSITLLEIHKLMYFMQEAGEPLRLRFTKGHYGPYASNLHHVLERIEGHFIRGYGDSSDTPGKNIEYLDEAVDQANQFLKSHQETQKRFYRIEQLIEGFETPYGMELLASIHWIGCHEDKRIQYDSILAVQAMKDWNPRKCRVFTEDHINIAWQRLHDLKWFEEDVKDGTGSSNSNP